MAKVFQVLKIIRSTFLTHSLCAEKCDIQPEHGAIAKASSFYKPIWFDAVCDEYTACRETVGLIDYSSYTKIDLWVGYCLSLLVLLAICKSLTSYSCFHLQSNGNEVVEALQYLCSNDVDVPIGSIIHTGLQNERGGYENDCSLIRINENLFVIYSLAFRYSC